ncbi:MAG: hypothetical protein IKE42_28315 [Aquamicrobium sp.]|nr:hypothetical protein [Aquamicrobium sp.]
MKALLMDHRSVGQAVFWLAVFLTGFLASWFVVSGANAQVATVSRTDLPTSSLNVSTGLQNAAGVNYFDNDGLTFAVLKSGGTTLTATFTTQQTSVKQDGYGTVPLSDLTVTIPSASTAVIGPFPPQRWNTPEQTVRVSLSTAVNVSITSFRPTK